MLGIAALNPTYELRTAITHTVAPGIFDLNNVCQRKNIVGHSHDPTYTKRDPVYAFVLPFSFVVQGEF